ncbi:Uncharacterized protein TPAR_08593 [Tolypocladium paradoxum]|uniref:Hemerythrin-like domain-containing protein n=1 Tax=Tolypocladium paradoxum TaxID=94208 RepID=A0A2S4KLY0_9HYPO|nr:Uncharacterized protein TPAR_08593 [Tolypocladium paradoxum]
MTIVHDCLIRGINAVYLQCVNVTNKGNAKDKKDFANFAYAWGRMINEHYTVEEEKILPEINEVTGVEGLMDANVNEHFLFLGGLSAYDQYVEKVRTGKEDWTAERLRAIIDSFMPTLQTHLENEITTLVRLEKYADKCDWDVWFQTTANQIASDGTRALIELP